MYVFELSVKAKSFSFLKFVMQDTAHTFTNHSRFLLNTLQVWATVWSSWLGDRTEWCRRSLHHWLLWRRRSRSEISPVHVAWCATCPWFARRLTGCFIDCVETDEGQKVGWRINWTQHRQILMIPKTACWLSNNDIYGRIVFISIVRK